MDISNKIKIIFLDIDGVLNVYPQGHDDYGSIFHDHFVDNLKWIIDETGADIVISSTWRMSGYRIMKEMWAKRNLPGKVIGITPNHMIKTGTTLQRGKEIDEFIKDYSKPITNYVILDDDTDMEPHQMNNFVKTSDNRDHPDCVDIGYGLTRKCAEMAIKILNNENT